MHSNFMWKKSSHDVVQRSVESASSVHVLSVLFRLLNSWCSFHLSFYTLALCWIECSKTHHFHHCSFIFIIPPSVLGIQCSCCFIVIAISSRRPMPRRFIRAVLFSVSSFWRSWTMPSRWPWPTPPFLTSYWWSTSTPIPCIHVVILWRLSSSQLRMV